MKHYSDEEIVGLLREVDVPEPSPLFWDHLSQRVRTAVASEPVPQSRWALNWIWLGGIAATLAVLMIAFSVTVHRSASSGGSIAVPHDAVEATNAIAPQLPPIEDDLSLAVVGEVAAQMDWADTGLSVTPEAAERAFSQLSQDEQRAAIELLEQEIKNAKTL